MNATPGRASTKRRKRPKQSEYDPATRRWFHSGFAIKRTGESTYYAWSHDWEEGSGRGKELGPCTTMEEMTQVLDKYEAKFPAG